MCVVKSLGQAHKYHKLPDCYVVLYFESVNITSCSNSKLRTPLLIQPSLVIFVLQKLILQKAFSSQQLVHITVINLFELHHLRDLANEGDDQTYTSDEQISWFQLLGLFSMYTILDDSYV